jgi:carboxy-terminal domain RNA polymerase II polypeptide A small phosphatase
MISYPNPPAKALLKPLLPLKEPEHAGCPTLVIDLDETLVHTSYHMPPVGTHSFQMQDPVDGRTVYVAIRPGVQAFLAIMAEHYELVLFTAATQVSMRLPISLTTKHYNIVWTRPLICQCIL